jgi:hypothetical protein
VRACHTQVENPGNQTNIIGEHFDSGPGEEMLRLTFDKVFVERVNPCLQLIEKLIRVWHFQISKLILLTGLIP